jgi:hypothetical protein
VVNWHLSDHVRLEFAYGCGTLNRFNVIGTLMDSRSFIAR